MAQLSAEVIEFLTSGQRTGKLGYTAADGRPLVVPIWYVLLDGQIAFTTGGKSAKARALARDPRVVLCVDDERPPYAFAQVQGVAEVGQDLDELYRVAAACGARYLGADRADEFGKRNGVPGELVVRIRPTKVIAQFDLIAPA